MKPLLVLLSAGLYSLSFPPWNVPALTWVALVPLFAALHRAAPARGFLAGLLWGTTMIWGVGHWVPAALSTYWGQPAWFGILCSLLGSLIFVGSYIAGFGLCAALVCGHLAGVGRCVALAVLWVAWEVARGRLLTGDPWLLAGYGLTGWPVWIQIADLGGVHLVSLVVAFTNACIAEALLGRALSPARRTLVVLSAAGVLIAVHSYGRARLDVDFAGEPNATVAIIQGNNDLGSQWRSDLYGKGLEDYLRLSREALREGPIDLLVWPESAVTFFLAREPGYQEAIRRLLAEGRAGLIVGAPHYEDPDPARPQYYNSAFYMTGKEGVRERYDKVHLLPFGEYFPLRTIGLLRRRFERVRTFTPGRDIQLLDIREGKAAVVICFEAIFPDLVRQRMAGGAGFLVNLSNDAWLGGAAGAQQHLLMVPMRAVENRTWVVRATTTGISAIIDPHGRVRARTDIGREEILRGTIATRSSPTFYQRRGDWVAVLSVALSGVLLAFPLAARRKHGAVREPSH